MGAKGRLEKRGRLVAAVVVALAVIVGHAGCGSAPNVTTTEGKTPSPTSPVTRTFSPTPYATELTFTVAGAPIDPPVDSGATEGANGTANYVGGSLLSYTVAADDIYEKIAHRFGLDMAYLFSLNGARRQGVDLWIGDTINLSAFHIESIGDENGVVYNNPPPVPIPPQRAADEP